MIDRYKDAVIEATSTDEARLARWQDVELAVIDAGEEQAIHPPGTTSAICERLLPQAFDIDFWLKKDHELHHDYGAGIEERRQYLPPKLARFYHGLGITSYDGVDNSNVLMLRDFVARLEALLDPVEKQLERLAHAFRFLPMLERTHGQGMEIQSVGYRFLRALSEYRLVTRPKLDYAKQNLRYGKISGTIGNNSTVLPELEIRALARLGLERYPGASQILPRSLWIGIAEAVTSIVQGFQSITDTIWVSARSGLPIMQEGFTGTQIPSSASPWKRNPIRTEQMRGLAAACIGYETMLKLLVPSIEGRIIDQSCVERFAWADLFHIATWAAKVMTTILTNLEVHPDHILEEIARLRGCYAANQAKELLAELSLEQPDTILTTKEAYRLIQLASWITFEQTAERTAMTCQQPMSLAEGEDLFDRYCATAPPAERHLLTVILTGKLHVVADLEITAKEIDVWVQKLAIIFADSANRARFVALSHVSNGMANENAAYQQILGLETQTAASSIN